MKAFKRLACFAAAGALALSGAFVSYAGQWEQDSTGWKYQLGGRGYLDGFYLKTGSYWIDGNQDGIYEEYAFDSCGYMVAESNDVFSVNSDGAILQDGSAAVFDLAAMRDRLGSTVFKPEIAALLYSDEAAVIETLGQPANKSTYKDIYKGAYGDISVSYVDGKAESITGCAGDLLNFTKSRYTIDEINEITGETAENLDSVLNWCYSDSPRVDFSLWPMDMQNTIGPDWHVILSADMSGSCQMLP